MNFTGERYIPSVGGEIRLEHMHRYAWATALCVGMDVLDVACGEGYGSAILAKKARSVVGVDVSAEAVDHASSFYRQIPNLSFRTGSAAALPCDDTSFDAVVSFETIEHLAEQELMLDNILRALRPSGLLIISSPNRPVYSGQRDHPNEFHVKELDLAEFDGLLRPRFRHVTYLGQRMIAGSALLPADDRQTTYEGLIDTRGEMRQGIIPWAEIVYFVGICSNGGPAPSGLRASLALSEAEDPIRRHLETVRWARSLEAEISSAREALSKAAANHAQTVDWARSMESELSRTRAAFESLSLEYEVRTKWALELEKECASLRSRIYATPDRGQEASTRAKELDSDGAANTEEPR